MTVAKTFDAVFDKYRGNIPLDYLRSLSFLASGLNPSKSIQGSAGMFMIPISTLDAYNKKIDENNEPAMLADPALNTKIACWVLTNIVNYYKSNNVMPTDWNNPEYVNLVTHGYNCGYNKTNGTSAAILKVKPVSIDNVAAYAKVAKMNSRLYDTKAINFAKSVTNLFLGTPKNAVIPQTTTKQKSPSGAGLAALIGLPVAAFLLMKRK